MFCPPPRLRLHALLLPHQLPVGAQAAPWMLYAPLWQALLLGEGLLAGSVWPPSTGGCEQLRPCPAGGGGRGRSHTRAMSCLCVLSPLR